MRVVLTVLVAVALLAASLPALESAQATTTAERLDSEGERIERAVAGVTADSVAVEDPTLAARTTMSIHAPSGLTAAPIDRLALVDGTEYTVDSDGGADARRTAERAETNGSTDTSVALLYQIAGGPVRTVPFAPGTPVATVDVADGTVELRPSGRSRLELRFVDDGGPTVRISRVG